MSRTWMVTGTDTGIGKTFASTALLHALRAAGLRAVGMKPVASGCSRTADGWRNDDALALQAASDPSPAYDDVNPYALPLATAPQLAARDAGVEVERARILAAHTRLSAMADRVLVEGAGGWAAPLAGGEGAALEHADLARALDAGVILVVGLRLGCLSHARLTARAVAADGLLLLGWIGNAIDPAFDRTADYVDLLDAALPAPRLGVLPHGADPRRAAAALDLHGAGVAGR